MRFHSAPYREYFENFVKKMRVSEHLELFEELQFDK